MDFHCHLDLYPNAREVYAQTLQRNVFTWLVTTSPRAFEATSKVLGSHPRILISPGLHPEIVHERYQELPLLLEQIDATKAVGEVGLDGSRQFQRSYQLQREAFTSIVKRCHELGGRMLSIHSRQAVKDILDTLVSYPDYGTAVLHWFSGGGSELRLAMDHGCWFSVGPAAFATAAGRSLAKKLPRDRVVLESDGPFAQIDGVSVMPWCSGLTNQLLAEAWGIPYDEVALILDNNAQRLLSIMDIRFGSVELKNL